MKVNLCFLELVEDHISKADKKIIIKLFRFIKTLISEVKSDLLEDDTEEVQLIVDQELKL